jgi:hypothetical protein
VAIAVDVRLIQNLFDDGVYFGGCQPAFVLAQPANHRLEISRPDHTVAIHICHGTNLPPTISFAG